MVSFLDAVALSQDLFSDVIEIFDSCREPRDLNRAYFGDIISDDLKLLNCGFHIIIFQSAFDVYVKVGLSPVVLDHFRWFRGNSSHVDLVRGKDVEGLVKDTM